MTLAAYHDLVETLLACEVPIDRGQIYFDARLSHHHPTVEVRVADVCLQPDDAVLQAALTRAIVEAAARVLATNPGHGSLRERHAELPPLSPERR